MQYTVQFTYEHKQSRMTRNKEALLEPSATRNANRNCRSIERRPTRPGVILFAKNELFATLFHVIHGR
jgi:hypothetical protein